MTLPNGSVVEFGEIHFDEAAREVLQASSTDGEAPPRKGAEAREEALPEKDAEEKEHLELSPEDRAALEEVRVSQLMIDDPVAFEQYVLDSALERDRQLEEGKPR